nr:HAD hydrolase family protein [Mycoplasmopsis bovis]
MKQQNTLMDLYKDKYSVYLTNRIYTDVNPLGISKWNGLKEFMRIYNMQDCIIYAFGDSSNDVEMLQNAHFFLCYGKCNWWC